LSIQTQKLQKQSAKRNKKAWKQLQKNSKKNVRKQRVRVNTSLAHRQTGTYVHGYYRNSSTLAYRNQTHKRNPRRTKAEIALHGTRKEQRQEKRMNKIKKSHWWKR